LHTFSTLSTATPATVRLHRHSDVARGVQRTPAMKTTAITSAIALLALAGTVHAEPPAERTHKLIETFKAVKAPPDGGKLTADDEAANVKAFAALDAFFDFTTFGADCLGPSASKLSPAQAKEFKERLMQILRHRGYPNGGSVFREGVIKEGKPTERGGTVAVPLKVSFPNQDIAMDVEFVWNKAGKIVDLVLDGDSLSKDTRNQVGRIVAKNGADDLLRRVTEKQKESEK
jgi:ABC-type transporter MlaC component